LLSLHNLVLDMEKLDAKVVSIQIGPRDEVALRLLKKLNRSYRKFIIVISLDDSPRISLQMDWIFSTKLMIMRTERRKRTASNVKNKI